VKASLAIEAIGQNSIRSVRDMDRFIGVASGCRPDLMPWRHGVWRIMYSEPMLEHGRWDYSQANGKGSRGVYIHYILESGRLYQVAAPTSWKSTDHYYCTVSEDGDIVRITKEEAQEWLARKHSA